jgi:putative hydrolase of the HAD superfamily
MKPLSQYKAVFFDAGDTLLTVEDDRGIFQRFLQSRGMERNVAEIGQLLDESIRLFYAERRIDPGALCSPESDQLFWMEIYLDVLHKLGAEEKWQAAELAELSRELYEEYHNPAHYILFPDVRQTLEQLQSLSLRLGIISNFSVALRLILQDQGILDLFDPLIISTEVGIEKPNPDIFRLALSRSGLEAHEVLYVGDHEANDVWAPHQIGMDAVRIMRYPHQTGEGIHTLTQLVE